MVQIDKGPLPNPGGSTGHASNFIFPTDHNKEMAFLTLESQRQYIEHGLNNTSRRHRGRPQAGAARGVQPAHDVGQGVGHRRQPADARGDQGARPVHQRGDPPRRLLHTERVVCRLAARPARRCATRPSSSGALQVFANTEVLDIETEDGPGGPKVTAVVTNKGRIEAEHVAIACGVWSPRIAKMAGANIPLTPAVHQMADVGPIDILQQSGKEVAYPIVRDMDTFCYERQTAGSMEVGSLRPPSDLHAPRRHPLQRGVGAVADRAAVHRRRLRPAVRRGDRPDGRCSATAEIRYAINGLAEPHPRRQSGARRDARGAQPVERRRGVDQGRAPASPSSSPSG